MATDQPHNTISVSDPLVTLARIKRFGLASDGSALRDLEAAIVRLRSERNVNGAIADVNLASCDVRDAELDRLRTIPEGNTKAQIAHAIDHFEPPFIGELANERETWIADNMRHEIVMMVRALPSLQEWRGIEGDARRYRRLQILGCAPCGSQALRTATVLRFTNLDEFVDEDLKWNPSRGEAQPLPAPPSLEKSGGEK